MDAFAVSEHPFLLWNDLRLAPTGYISHKYLNSGKFGECSMAQFNWPCSIQIHADGIRSRSTIKITLLVWVKRMIFKGQKWPKHSDGQKMIHRKSTTAARKKVKKRIPRWKKNLRILGLRLDFCASVRSETVETVETMKLFKALNGKVLGRVVHVLPVDLTRNSLTLGPILWALSMVFVARLAHWTVPKNLVECCVLKSWKNPSFW